ncbi:MAG TPA: thiamine pyrophosphate-binding protein [Candidatus Dormibacteraeota bacterium]|nr:thiamine pyrophosphate-binding protein [Candidatus Dormibacteraeota bacterium]
MTTERLLTEEVGVPEAIVRVLEQAGIDTVFGMPGGRTLAIYDALHDHRDTIRTVLVRHESLAGVMAEVYGRVTGRPGVAMGQGAFMLSNAALGTLEALLAGSPMLILSDLSDGLLYSHHAPYQAGSGEHGNWDAKQAFQGFTKETMVPLEGVQAVQETQLALKHALTGQPGPVALLYGTKALRSTVGPDSAPILYPTSHYLPVRRGGPDPRSVQHAAQAIRKAERPVIIAGNGVRVGRAYSQLMQVAELLRAPVATTASGKGVFPEHHPLALGMLGTFGLDSANAVIADADLVLAVGTKLGPSDTVNETADLLDPVRQTFVQLDIEPLNAAWTFPVDHVVIGDAAVSLSEIAACIGGRGAGADGAARVEEARRRLGGFETEDSRSDAIPMRPQRVIAELQRALPESGMVTADAGENRIFLAHHFQSKTPGSFLQPAAIGGMGYAIPAALALKLLNPERPVVAVCGDGGFAMSMYGLMTAREQDLPIVVLVMNNSILGWVVHGQGERLIASEFADFDHAAIARAMGCDGVRVHTPQELASALGAALGSNRPTVIDAITSRDQSFQKITSRYAKPDARKY